jgi:archaellum biogenesis ATPase FlaH
MSLAKARAKANKTEKGEIEPDQIDILAKLNDTQYIPGYNPPIQDIVFSVDEKIVGTLGNFVTISGQPKARKSTITHAILASALIESNVFRLYCKLPQQKNEIVLVDTEQSKYDFYRSLDRLKRMADISDFPKRFTAYNTRHFKPMENILALHQIASRPNVGMIVIDGLLDLIMDFNDVHECKNLIDNLKYITEKNNVFMLVVLHQSKGTNMTIGHLGSMSDRFSQATIEVIKHDDGVTEVKPKFMRSDEHFNPIHIYWDHRISNYNLYWTDYTPPKNKSKS